MLLLAFAIAFTHSAAGPESAQTALIPYVILADQARRDRVTRLLDDLAGTGFRSAPAAESGMTYVGCVTAWRGDLAQATSCIQSRLASGTIVLNGYEQPSRAGETLISCIGSGGRETFVLRAEAANRDPAALRQCITAAARDGGAPPAAAYDVRFAPELAIADAAEARAQAASVLTIAIDHVGIPRGVTGTCLVQGRVADVVRGAGAAARTPIELGIPCAAEPHGAGSRRIAMSDIQEGSFATLYLSDRQQLLDFAPLVR